MVKEYKRPISIEEALKDLDAFPGSSILAGGTFLLSGYSFGSQILRNPAGFLAAGDSRAAGSPPSAPLCVIDVSRILPDSIERKGTSLRIGALCTFQKIAESRDVPEVFRKAAMSMANRNIRNRATVGGNLGANKSCASLVPLLLALEAEVEFATRYNLKEKSGLASWLADPKGIILAVTATLEPGMCGSSMRSSRTACDLSTSTVALVYKKDEGRMHDLRIALGGFGPCARRFPEIESLFEGKNLPASGDIEKAVLPLLKAISDQRGSAEFKQHRGAVLLADALLQAEACI